MRAAAGHCARGEDVRRCWLGEAAAGPQVANDMVFDVDIVKSAVDLATTQLFT